MAETHKKYFMFWHHSFVWQEPIKTIILCWNHSSVWQENSFFTLCVAGELIKTIIIFCPFYGRNRNSYKNISCSDITPQWQKLIKKYFVFWHHSSVTGAHKNHYIFLNSLLCMAGTHKNSVPMSVFCIAGEFQFLISLLGKKNSYKVTSMAKRPQVNG